ncbi:NAD-dependent epimerase/dehydratase family protein [Inquilinus limosus]|uniref:NAD-dependent epimerase/dehydratase family protein n=1 Tax=Inquilinus limosus TaxID=171674 RepID=UPI000421E931|nr:NAD(P)-dependent oxidoreductase [Inquilinus limosus]
MIVVTGSAGYLGSRIVTSLLCAGPVAGVDRAEAPTVTHRADILDGVTLRRAFRGARVVIHTAGLNGGPTGGPGAPAPAEEMRRINVGGTEAVIAAARDAGVRRLVLTSTTALYGGAIRPAAAAVWVTEELPAAPETPYEESKRDAEALVLAAAGTFPEGCLILRCGRFFPAPPNETVNDRLYRGVDPRDVAAAHIAAAERPGGGAHVLNIAAASPFTPGDCAALRRDPLPALRRRHPFVEGAYRQLGWRLPTTIDRVISIERARGVIGYTPQHNFREALAEQLWLDAWPRRSDAGPVRG